MNNLDFDIAETMGGLYGDGFIGRKAAFTREWVSRLHEEVTEGYKDALNRSGGAVAVARNATE